MARKQCESIGCVNVSSYSVADSTAYSGSDDQVPHHLCSLHFDELRTISPRAACSWFGLTEAADQRLRRLEQPFNPDSPDPASAP